MDGDTEGNRADQRKRGGVGLGGWDEERTVMKRKNVFTWMIVMIFLSFCTACAEDVSSSGGEKEDGQSNALLNEQIEEVRTEEIQTNEIQTSEISTEKFSDSVDTSDTRSAEDTYSEQSAFSRERTTRVSPVRLVFCTEEQITKMEGDNILCMKRYLYPVVTIEENENAADKINADIQERVNSFRVDTLDVLDDAAYIDEVIQDDPEYHDYNYTEEQLRFTAARADSKVISFLVDLQHFTGGMFILDTYTGLNYDTQTGELLDFVDLSEHADVFEQGTFTFLQNLTSTKEGIVWRDDIADLTEALDQNNQWYLSTSGLVLCSGPHQDSVFWSYYGGNTELVVPYSKLEEIGLKEKYDCDGVRTTALQTEEVCFSDLDGDGQEEEIQFYIDGIGNADTNIHLMIDGIDYAVELEELSRQLSDDDYLFCWAECYLYKMDKTDTTTEIAFEMNYTSLKEDVVTPCTFCYRYEGGGVLTPLGKMEGTITDPTAVCCIMPQDSTADE